jgi:hypothetical protein
MAKRKAKNFCRHLVGTEKIEKLRTHHIIHWKYFNFEDIFHFYDECRQADHFRFYL